MSPTDFSAKAMKALMRDALTALQAHTESAHPFGPHNRSVILYGGIEHSTDNAPSCDLCAILAKLSTALGLTPQTGRGSMEAKPYTEVESRAEQAADEREGINIRLWAYIGRLRDMIGVGEMAPLSERVLEMDRLADDLLAAVEKRFNKNMARPELYRQLQDNDTADIIEAAVAYRKARRRP